MVHKAFLPFWICAAVVIAAGTAVPREAAAFEAGVSLAGLPQKWQDDSGEWMSLNALSGRPVVLTMAYAKCHRICPMTMAELERLQQSLDAQGTRAEFIIVGYDPQNEGPAEWRQYRLSHRLRRANWHFVTGSVEDVTLLAHRLHFERWKYDEHVMHDSRVMLFDAQGLPTGDLVADADAMSRGRGAW